METIKEKHYLFTDTATFSLFKSKEDQILINYKELRKVASGCLGMNSINDIEAFLEDPIEWLIEEYWNSFGRTYNPPHASHRVVFLSSNDVDLNAITKLQKEIKSLVKEMRTYAPTISKKGIKTNLKEESFFKYLNPKRADEFFALQDFVNASDVLLKNYNAQGTLNLVRFANGLRFNGTSVEINLYEFI